IGGGRDKIETLIEPLRFLIFCVNGKSANASDVGGVKGSEHRVFQQSFAYAAILPTAVDREAGQEHDRDGVTCQTFTKSVRSVIEQDLSDGKGVIADHRIVKEPDICS